MSFKNILIYESMTFFLLVKQWMFQLKIWSFSDERKLLFLMLLFHPGCHVLEISIHLYRDIEHLLAYLQTIFFCEFVFDLLARFEFPFPDYKADWAKKKVEMIQLWGDLTSSKVVKGWPLSWTFEFIFFWFTFWLFTIGVNFLCYEG